MNIETLKRATELNNHIVESEENVLKLRHLLSDAQSVREKEGAGYVAVTQKVRFGANVEAFVDSDSLIEFYKSEIEREELKIKRSTEIFESL